jgi:hypothetical protein
MDRKIRILFLKPEDPNLNGNNIILDYFKEKERFSPGSMNIYYLPDLTLLTLAGRVKKIDGERFELYHIDEDADGRVENFENFDIVYMNAKSQQSTRAYRIAELCMKMVYIP